MDRLPSRPDLSEQPAPLIAQKRTEEALHDSEAKYRAVVEQVPAVVYLDSHDAEHPETLFINRHVEDLLGIEPEEFLRDADLWVRTIHPDDRDRFTTLWAGAVATERPFEAEYRVVASDGTVRSVTDRTVPIRDDEGAIRYWQGVVLDNTDRRAVAEALAESETKYRALVENIPAVVYIVAPDGDGSTLYVSPQVEQLLGYTQDEWLDQPDIWMELLHPDDREPTLDAYDRHNETGEPWSREYRLIASDGRSVWFKDEATLVRDEAGAPLIWQGIRMEVTLQKDAEEVFHLAHEDLDRRVRERTSDLEEANELMMLEVAERRRTETRLRQAEERYRKLVERLPAVTYVWETDPTTSRALEYTSPQLEEMFGFTIEEWESDPEFWISRVHPHDRDRAVASWMRSASTGEPFGGEFRYLAKDGRVVWVLDEAVLIARDDAGRPKTFQGLMVDITERRETAARLRAVEAQALAIARHLPAVTYAWEFGDDPAEPGPATYVSTQISSVLGYTPEEWISHRDFYLGCIHPDDRERAIAHDAGLRPGSEWVIEYRYLAKDGNVVWVRDAGTMVAASELGDGPVVQGILIDITAEKEAEERLRSAEERYRTLVEQIPAITYIESSDPSDPQRTRLVFVSPQSSEIFGYTPEELLAEPDHITRMIHPDDLALQREAEAYANRTGEPYFCEYRIRARDGHEVWIQSRATLVRDDEGRPHFWHGVALDVTERRRVEEELAEIEGRLGDLRATAPPPDPRG